MSQDVQPTDFYHAKLLLNEARCERDRTNGEARKAFNDRDKARRLHEIIYDLAFEFGVRWQSCDEAFTNELDLMLGGALGRRDMIYEWANLFDEAWQVKLDLTTDDGSYWEDIGSFFQAAFEDLGAKVNASIALKTRVISVQVVPITETQIEGRLFAQAQTQVDSDTTGWGVYKRFGDGTVEHACDCANKNAALMMGSLLAQSYGVQIEPGVKP